MAEKPIEEPADWLFEPVSEPSESEKQPVSTRGEIVPVEGKETAETRVMYDSAKKSPAPEMHDFENETYLPEPVEEVIDGHTIAPHEFRAFEHFCVTGSISEAARAGGVAPSTIFRWRHQMWWRTLIEQHLRFHQERFAAKIAAHADEVADGLLEVARGDDKSDKTASARIQAAKVFAELGRDPLVDRRARVSITNQTLKVSLANIDASEFANMSPAEIRELAMPDSFRK